MQRTLTSPTRVAALASILFAVAFFLTVASVNVPHQASDKELLDWWHETANVNSGVASMFFAIIAAVLFAVVGNHLRTLFAHAGLPHWSAFAHTMAGAVTATMLVSAALRGVIGLLVHVEDGPVPDISVLRYTTALNYSVIGVTMASMAMTILAVSVLVVRTAVLPAWLGYLGFVSSALIVVAVALMLGGFGIPVANLWAICLGVALWRMPAPVSGSVGSGSQTLHDPAALR